MEDEYLVKGSDLETIRVLAEHVDSPDIVDFVDKIKKDRLVTQSAS